MNRDKEEMYKIRESLKLFVFIFKWGGNHAHISSMEIYLY